MKYIYIANHETKLGLTNIPTLTLSRESECCVGVVLNPLLCGTLCTNEVRDVRTAREYIIYRLG